MNNFSSVAMLIEKATSEMGVILPSTATKSFELYAHFLIKHNQVQNLTTITDIKDLVQLHFLDSLALLSCDDFKNASVLDVGSGAGFPGVPLKIAEPSIRLTLLDATKKRVNFLTMLCSELELDASCIHARAEDLSQPDSPSQMREMYDVVVSRAVARLNILCELCLPFLRVGGIFPAMKSIDTDEEIRQAENAIGTLGANVEKIVEYTIPDTSVQRRIILIRKISQTPDKYPRRFARIEKKPL